MDVVSANDALMFETARVQPPPTAIVVRDGFILWQSAFN
jgi:hypothetical protein